MQQFRTPVQVCKVDAELGIVFGFAVVCKSGGEDYFDLQGHCIPEDEMLQASAEFMAGSRVAKEMHGREPGEGTVVYAFPLTSEIARALSIRTEMTGLLIGMRPAPEVLAKFQDGTYKGFSVAGVAVQEATS